LQQQIQQFARIDWLRGTPDDVSDAMAWAKAANAEDVEQPHILLNLQKGDTGEFTVRDMLPGGGCSVDLRDGEGNALDHTVVWLPPKKRAPRRWTEIGRGWFPKSYCQEHPALPAADMARQAAEAFDGSINGPEYLIFPQGAPFLRVDHPEESKSWAFGMLLDQAAAQERPVLGWFPVTYEGDPAQCSNGPIRADYDFDAHAQGYTSDYLILRQVDVLVPMWHSGADGMWGFGALLTEKEFPTATPPDFLPPEGLFRTSPRAIAGHEDPIITATGLYHGQRPRGSGVIALRWLQGGQHVCLVESRKARRNWGAMSFPKGGRKNDEPALDCAEREWLEETGISSSRVRFLPGAYLDEARTGTRYFLAQCDPPAQGSGEPDDACGEECNGTRSWKPPGEDPQDRDPIVSAHWVRVEDAVKPSSGVLVAGRVTLLKKAFVMLRGEMEFC